MRRQCLLFLCMHMKVKSKSKINIGLDVVSKRPDGYHNIKTIMHEIDLYDEMYFSRDAKGFKLISDLKIPLEENLIYKAYRAFCYYVNEDLNLEVRLKKLLPMGAGIAGGTFNGASTIKYLNEAYGYNMEISELISFSKVLGADFSYCLTGGKCLAEGTGDILTSISYPEPYILLINPGYEVSTKEVYQNLTLEESRVDFDLIIKNLKNKDIKRLNESLKNSMERYVFEKHGDLDIIKREMVSLGGASLMSGSGSTIFGIFYDIDSLKGAKKHFENKYEKVYCGGSNE